MVQIKFIGTHAFDDRFTLDLRKSIAVVHVRVYAELVIIDVE